MAKFSGFFLKCKLQLETFPGFNCVYRKHIYEKPKLIIVLLSSPVKEAFVVSVLSWRGSL
jgi:hypothetical protein